MDRTRTKRDKEQPSAAGSPRPIYSPLHPLARIRPARMPAAPADTCTMLQHGAVQPPSVSSIERISPARIEHREGSSQLDRHRQNSRAAPSLDTPLCRTSITAAGTSVDALLFTVSHVSSAAGPNSLALSAACLSAYLMAGSGMLRESGLGIVRMWRRIGSGSGHSGEEDAAGNEERSKKTKQKRKAKRSVSHSSCSSCNTHRSHRSQIRGSA